MEISFLLSTSLSSFVSCFCSFNIFLKFGDSFLIISSSLVIESFVSLIEATSSLTSFISIESSSFGISTLTIFVKGLENRARAMNNELIKIDMLVSSALDLKPDIERVARAENYVEDGKIDSRRD